MDDERGIGKILIAFFVGGAIGALTGLLLAPTSGAEARRKIKGVSLEVKDKALEKAEAVKSEATKLVSRGKEKVSEVKSRIRSAAESAEEAAEEELTSESEEA